MIESETLELKKSTSELIYNSEQFQEGYTPTDFIKGAERSIPKNPLLANTLYLSKDITRIFRVIDLAENAGYGFDKMFKGWKSHYSKAPVVSTGLDYYSIEFFYNAKDNVEDTVKDTVEEKDLEKDLVSDLEKDLRLTKNQRRIITEINKNSYITQQELSVIIGINEKNVRNNIAKLKEKRLIKRIGPDKSGHWAIQKNTK